MMSDISVQPRNSGMVTYGSYMGRLHVLHIQTFTRTHSKPTNHSRDYDHRCLQMMACHKALSIQRYRLHISDMDGMHRTIHGYSTTNWCMTMVLQVTREDADAQATWRSWICKEPALQVARHTQRHEMRYELTNRRAAGEIPI